MLVVDSLHFSYPGRRLLTGVYLEVSAGAVVGILGRNGSGKSTLLELIFGMKEEAGGFVSWEGEAVRRLYTLKGVAAYLPQDSFLPKRARVDRIVRQFLASGDRSRRVLADERVAPFARRRVHTLSGGERRYLELSLLLQGDYKLLLLDEPLNEMDPVGREVVRSAIRLASETRAVLLTGHVYRDIIDLSRRVFVLTDGRLYEAPTEQDARRLGFLPLRGREEEDWEGIYREPGRHV